MAVKLKGKKLSEAILSKISELKENFSIQIGIAAGSKYPNGQSVAKVACCNEYETPHIPARPTFSIVPFKYGDEWPSLLQSIFKQSGGKIEPSLEAFGDMIVGQVRVEINNLLSPSLSPYTIKRKGTDKPLIDTGLLINSVTYQVIKK